MSKETTRNSKLKNAVLIAVVAILFIPLILPIIAVFFAARFVASIAVHLGIWLFWLPRSKNVLFVYSNSPNWQNYIEENILPQISEQAVVLNWSDRRNWRLQNLLARMAFKHFAGSRDFNPLAIVFRPFHLAKVFRFWQPFQDFKHGKTEALGKLQSEFFQTALSKNVNSTLR